MHSEAVEFMQSASKTAFIFWRSVVRVARMVRAERMTSQQIAEVVELARSDRDIWEMLKNRELEIEKRIADAAKQGHSRIDNHVDVVFDPPARPTMPEIIGELMKKRFGSDEHFVQISVIMEIRRLLRTELGLPT
jgi:hypothetical protein